MSREAGTGTRAVPLGEEATALRLLFVEDREDDCLLMVRELRDVMGGLAWRRVDSEPDLRQALAGESWDAVIADVHVPGLSLGLSLSLVAEVDRELPVIVVSGHVGEETAADVMKSGARDFVSKDRLARLRPAVEREVAEATVRRDARRQVGLRERRLEVLNRLYSVLARVGEAVVRRRDRDLLMGEVARILREDGGFRLVWVGSVDRAAGRVHPMAGIGTDDGFPTTAAFPLDREQEAGSGPPGSDGGHFLLHGYHGRMHAALRLLQDGIGGLGGHGHLMLNGFPLYNRGEPPAGSPLSWGLIQVFEPRAFQFLRQAPRVGHSPRSPCACCTCWPPWHPWL